MSAPCQRVIGLALGSGSARGWAHLGVIRALEEAGVRPNLVCGTSIGALVGAAYAAGELSRLEEWALGLGLKDLVALMDLRLSNGLLKGERLMEALRSYFKDRPIQDLPMPFGAVATSLRTGAEVWLREGSTLDAVRASIALPGLFTPVRREATVLVDGGLVNPVPVSLARAMGAEVVIAVDLGVDTIGRLQRPPPALQVPAGEMGAWLRKLQDKLGSLISEDPPDQPRIPSLLDVLSASINIMQVRLSRSRLAGDPPNLLIAPRLAHFGLLDFHRAAEAIAEGRRAVERVASLLPALRGQPI